MAMAKKLLFEVVKLHCKADTLARLGLEHSAQAIEQKALFLIKQNRLPAWEVRQAINKLKTK